jgi:hypothetical protein
MPLVSRAFILTGLAHLLAAMVLGVAVAAGPGALGLPPTVAPVYVHLLAVGWLTQLIFGVAHWMFPGRPRAPSMVSRVVLWACYALLNLGLVARAVAEPLVGRGGGWRVVLVAAGVAQLIAVVLFVGHTWPRVRAR